MRIIFFLTFFLVGLLCAQASVLRVSYTGGKQTGAFKIKGDHYNFQDTVGYFDTVIVDGNLLITNYYALKNFNNPPLCSFLPTHQYGLFIASQNGSLGKLGASDTIWTAARMFPNNPASLDTIPMPGYQLDKNFGGTPKGINVDTLFNDGECVPNQIHLIKGYTNIVYFSYNSGFVTLYGKLMIYGYGLSLNGFASSMSHLKIAYTISNTMDLDSGPVSIVQVKRQKINEGFSSGQFFDPLGRRQKIFEPSHLFIPLPLLSPTR